jgi:hypothetical protein
MRTVWLSDVYTPQAVVDGAAELVGSDERAMLRAVAKAAVRRRRRFRSRMRRLPGAKCGSRCAAEMGSFN